MDRREFLLLAGGTLVAGCVPVEGLENNLKKAMNGLSNPLDYLPSPAFLSGNRNESIRAKRIFDYVRANNTVPGPMSDIEGLQAAWDALVKQYPASEPMGAAAVIDFGLVLAPTIRMALHMEGVTYPVTGASKRTGSRRDLLWAVTAPRTFGGAELSRAGGRYVLNPGQGLTYDQQGYCLDPGIAPPERGEKFVLRPAGGLMPEPVRPLYDSLMRLASRDRSVHIQMQPLIWALRTSDVAGPSRVENLSAHHLRTLDRALPHGTRILRDYRKKRLAAKSGPSAKNQLAKLFNIQINGKELNVLEASDGELMSVLKTATAGGAIPNNNSQYSMLAPAVAARAVGTGTLQPRIEVINSSASPFVFDSVAWAACSERKVQRVALLAPKNPAFSNWSWPNNDTVAVTGANKRQMQRLLNDIGQDMQRRSMNPREINTKLRFSLPLTGDEKTDRLIKAVLQQVAKTGVEFIPLVGQSLSAYEAFTGKDWLTGEDLGWTDRMVSAVGIIPCGSVFKKLAGVRNMPRITQRMATSASLQRITQFASRNELRTVAADWALSDVPGAAFDYLGSKTNFMAHDIARSVNASGQFKVRL